MTSPYRLRSNIETTFNPIGPRPSDLQGHRGMRVCATSFGTFILHLLDVVIEMNGEECPEKQLPLVADMMYCTRPVTFRHEQFAAA
ncbi:hypothetical protein NQZ68_016779 [Dissostichus eleginoides]|nr:hypothetical protein NQZ68_016779 [Dissostichus eleginoides]